QIGLLWSVGVIAEIIMFAYATFFLSRWSWRHLIMLCLLITGLRWLVVGLFPSSFVAQFLTQTIHALSFGLFHMIAMRVIFQNFSAGQQGRGQALYSTMWGIGVATGSILAGHYWDQLGGDIIFFAAAASTLLRFLLLACLARYAHLASSTSSYASKEKIGRLSKPGPCLQYLCSKLKEYNFSSKG